MILHPGAAARTRLVIAAALLTVALPSAAEADSVAKVDPLGDAPPRLDIDRVTYSSTPAVVSAKVHVPDLIRSGGVSLRIASGAGGTDVGYAATVAVRADGSLSKTLSYFDNVSSTPEQCKVRGRWRVGKETVSIVVPRKCVPLIGPNLVYLAAGTISFIDEAEGDFAPPALHLASY